MLGLFLIVTALIGAGFLVAFVRLARSSPTRPALLASGLGMILIGLFTPRSGPVAPILAAVLIAVILFYVGGLARRRSRQRL